MHPIEQLRYVARASGADANLLVTEAISALGVFSTEPAALVTACRRLLTRQPAVGPLWWMSAHLVTASDVRARSRDLIGELYDDRTGRTLGHELPDNARALVVGWPDIIVSALPRRGDVAVLVADVEGQGPPVVRQLERADIVAEDFDPAHMAGAVEESTIVLVEAAAVGSAAALVDVGSVTAAAVAKACNVPVWLVAGVGRHLPEPYWQAITTRATDTDAPAFLSPFEVLSLGMVDRIVGPDGMQLGSEMASSSVPVAAELLRELR